MIPSVDATSVQLAMPLSVRKLVGRDGEEDRDGQRADQRAELRPAQQLRVKPTSASRSSTTLTGGGCR